MENLRQFFEVLSADWDAHQPEGRDQLQQELLAPYDPFFSPCRSIPEVGRNGSELIRQVKAFQHVAKSGNGEMGKW